MSAPAPSPAGAVVEHPAARACRTDLQGPLTEALFALAVLIDPPVGREGDVALAAGLAARLLPMLDPGHSAEAGYLHMAFRCREAALADAAQPDWAARYANSRSELAWQRRWAAREVLTRARVRLERLGVAT